MGSEGLDPGKTLQAAAQPEAGCQNSSVLISVSKKETGGHFCRRFGKRETMSCLQASRTLGKNMACPASPALMWVNPVLFSSLGEFPGFESHLPAAHTSLLVTGEAADRTVCLQTSVLAAGEQSRVPLALYHRLGAVQSHPDSDLFWPEPPGVAVTRRGVLFPGYLPSKSSFCFSLPSSLGGFV